MMVLKYNGADSLFSAARTQYAEKPKKADAAIKDLTQNPVSVVISKEGQEKYRSSMASDKVSETEHTTLSKDELPDAGVAFRISRALANEFYRIDDEKKPKGSRWGSAEDAAASMLEAYAALYDEIIRGYEDGTRVTYEKDESRPEGYRVLTKEEELEMLDLALEKMATSYETVRNLSVQGLKIMAEDNRSNAEYIARIRGRNEKYFELLDRAEKRERRAEKDKLPENFSLTILKGLILYKNQYPEIKDKENVIYEILKEAALNKK